MPEDERTGPPQRSALPTPPDEYDSPWKEVSGRFFPQLVEYFAPDVYGKIDWSAGYDFLEQELREVLRDSETGPRRVDKVVKVQTLTGKPLYLVLHIEIQASREAGFPLRMFVYYYRLFDLYPESVVSLAILADDDPGWKPGSYKHELMDTKVTFSYRTIKLSGYNERWQELERDPNPFALVVMAHLKTRATRGDAAERLRSKVELVRQLYGRGYRHEDVLELFRFIDWLLALPKEMEKSFRQKIDNLEQESKMKYVTSIERLSRKEGRQEGRQEGRKEGRQEVVLSLIETRFGPLDESLRTTVEQASGEQILRWAKRLLSASSLDEIFAT